jgi:hypothetical protein
LPTALLVAPRAFVVPAQIASRAAAVGKQICRITPGAFTHEERRRLEVQYFIEHPYTQQHADVNDPAYRAYVVEQFADIMKQFWE